MAGGILLTTILLFSAVAATIAGISDEKSNLPFSHPIQHTTGQLNSVHPDFLQTIGISHHAIHFARFAQEYGKSYDSVNEVRRRFEIFIHNLKQIEASNRAGLSYTLAINEFADLTWEEFRESLLGSSQENCTEGLKGGHIMADEKLPITKDWRNDGIINLVKNQGNCGSCWSFSATGALEAAYTQLTGKAISLSEQQLIDCSLKYNNFGCGGGFPSQAFEYIMDNGGIETEDTYPYVASNHMCRFNKENVAVKVIDSVNITLGDEDELKHAVGIVRPVSVGFEVVDDLRFYQKGVYRSNKCKSSPKDLNHAVLAVGYGEEDGIPYWIIKNSWGKRWGDDGFFKIELGKNMCGVATCACYPIVAAKLDAPSAHHK